MAELEQEYRLPVKTASHVLALLGDQLIGDEKLAIFELVKNGYDADANKVLVTLNLDGDSSSYVCVEDDGHGMGRSDIEEGWLFIGHSYKRAARSVRSPRYGRLPLGEKGVGRLAAFKLGHRLVLTTRKEGEREYEVRLDLDELLRQGPLMQDLSATLRSRRVGNVFAEGETGTRIEIHALRREEWSRGDVRRMQRLVTSLASPFATPDNFHVELKVPGRDQELAGTLGLREFLEGAPWLFEFSIEEDGRYSWKYDFRPPNWKDLKVNALRGNRASLLLVPEEEDQTRAFERDRVTLDAADLRDIGPIRGAIYGYFRRSEVLKASGAQQQLTMWLDDQTGVRIYRDGVRVFTYGERNDDWLGLNVRRINRPTGKFGTNSVVAGIEISSNTSNGLVEKTNREGFNDNDVFRRFRRTVLSVFDHFERTHAEDRNKLVLALKGVDPEAPPVRLTTALDNVKKALAKNVELRDTLSNDIKAIENEFEKMRDVMVAAGSSGLNLALVVHEVERTVESVTKAMDVRAFETAASQLTHLKSLLKEIGPLLRKEPSRQVAVSKVVRAALSFYEARFGGHKVVWSAPVLTGTDPDFKVKAPSNLLIGAIANAINNALFWSRARRDEEPAHEPAVAVRTSWNAGTDSGLIAVIDNGPGFVLSKEQAVQPFISTRPGGMGLGLYFAEQTMEICGGALEVASCVELTDELEIPSAYDGAAVVFRFGRTR
ncbi:ATP-binding protein [Ralstonia solanacearum species complex bacterium KE056]|uniref:ATP-binding protein n=1 Tax=Ralstonia solanacearum species complex bacterium KE056 TaxID=3119585 RepID=UPI002FC27DD1